MNLGTLAAINRDDVVGASLSGYFAPYSGPVLPHNMQIYFNSTQVGGYTNQIPFGTYFFPINPADLNQAGSPVGTINQVVGIRTQHPNGGHYQVNSNTRLDLVLDNFTQYACATSPQNAINAVTQNTQTNPTQVAIEITYPTGSTEVALGEAVTLQAEVNDFLDQQTSYPVQATVTYLDQLVEGVPCQETISLPYIISLGSQDLYYLKWTPVYTGRVTITAQVNTMSASDSDTIDLMVRSAPPDLTVKVLNPPNQPAEGETIHVQARVTNLAGEINQAVTLRFKYYLYKITSEEQGATARVTASWVEQVTHTAQPTLQLGAGASMIVTDDFTVPVAGSYQVEVTVDP